MADNDRNRGYRDNEYRRPRPRTAQPGDPLAELARLIGQQNESAPSYRQNGASQSDADQGWTMPPDPYAQPERGRDPGASHWPAPYPDSPAVTPSAYGGGQYDPRYDSAASQDQGYGRTPYAPSYGDQRYGEPQYPDSRYADPQYPDARYHDPRYAEPRFNDGAGAGYPDQGYAEPNFGAPQSRYAPQGYPQSGADQGHAGYGYQDGGQSYANGYYGAPSIPPMTPGASDQAPARRRGSLVTVLAVFALAVVGTAAAFGYRAMFGGTGTAVPPPVIKADTRPSKVVPATDPNAKPIQDRIGVKTERIVPREETPVQQTAPGQPRVIAPWLAGQNPQAFPPASANVAPSGSAPAPAAAQPNASQPAAAEPKRIRTVPIKPEQQGTAPASRGSRGAAAAPAAETDSDLAHAGGAPLALSPTGSQPQRHAARQPAPTVTHSTGSAAGAAPFPTPISGGGGNPAAAGNAVSGPYAVQVTSQRSEADAQASFRSLQQQFPSVLGNRHPVIRRADLGEKGTYYRAQIPFASQGEASEFCSNLKSAGGQCVVARN